MRIDKDRDVVQDQWAILTPPAIRNGVAYICRQAFGMSAIAFGVRAGVVWSSFSDQPESTTPAIAAPTLAGDHCLFTLLSGGLAITRLPDTEALPISHVAAQTVAMPDGAVITSSPAISKGAVYFGSPA